MTRSPSERPAESSDASFGKTPTGIRGVDKVLLGGLPRGRTTLVAGGPGTGKTVAGLEFLYRGAVKGEPGVFVTFEEQAAAIRRNAQTFGWDVETLEQEGKLMITEAEMPPDLLQSGEFDIGGLLGILNGQIQSIGARRLVIDALDMLLRVFREPHRQQNQLLTLHKWLLQQARTSLITMKSGGRRQLSHDDLEYMTDCVIRLDQRVCIQLATRRLRVLKYRGSNFRSNEYPYLISPSGIVLLPITNSELAQQSIGDKFPTGVNGLDPLLEGGFRRGSCILVGGASGTGKTTLACSLALAACNRGERVLFVSFEESVEGLVSGMQSPGVDLTPAMDGQSLKILTALPEATGVEEHLWRILRTLEALSPQHLVVDAISACRRMGSDAVAFDFLVRLLTICKNQGVTCVFLNQTDPQQPVHQISGVGISSLVDALLVLEQEWPEGAHRRCLLIVKVRGSRHSHNRHSFQITNQGMIVGNGASAALGSSQELS